MKPSHHVVISFVSGVILSMLVSSYQSGIACFLSGVLIDIDHHLEYYMAKGKFPFKYTDLVNFCVNERKQKIYLFLHSYEILFILWWVIYLFSLRGIVLGIAVGMSIHILCDQIVNPLRFPFYFIFFRIKHRFNSDVFYKS